MEYEKTPTEVALERPVRPDCFEFAMDFLGGPEDEQVRAYVAALEAWADASLAAERERCAAYCDAEGLYQTARAIRSGEHLPNVGVKARP